MDKQNAVKWLTQVIMDLAATLPPSARGPVIAVGEQCLATLSSVPEHSEPDRL